MGQKKALKDCNLKEIKDYIELKFENDKQKIFCTNIFADCSVQISTLDENKLKSGSFCPDDIICNILYSEDIIEVE